MRRRRGGLLGTAARTAVIAGTAQSVSGKVARRQAATDQAKSAPSSDRIGDIERLARLRDSGALSEAEFKREKAKLMK